MARMSRKKLEHAKHCDVDDLGICVCGLFLRITTSVERVSGYDGVDRQIRRHERVLNALEGLQLGIER